MPFSSTFPRASRARAKAEHLPQPTETRAQEARRVLLEKIGEFVTRHDLAVTAPNMATICGALSGSQPEMARALVQREAAGEPIDQRWLDTLMRLDPEIGGRMAELETLMDKLEYAVLRFAQTTKSVQDETSGHRGAIGAQIEAMAEASLSGDRVAEFDRVIEMSRAMLTLIEQAEQAMEKSQAETRELRENLARARLEADVDHLTGLPNRRAFERRFAAATEEARTRGTALCVAFCDVDRFKAINDTHGHEAGDRILCAIAATLGSHASATVFVARHGGEEFAVLLQGFDRDAAWRKLDTMRRAQADKRLLDRETGKPFGKVTFSAGVAEVNVDSDPRGALGRADAALYEAKNSGRNRVVAV